MNYHFLSCAGSYADRALVDVILNQGSVSMMCWSVLLWGGEGLVELSGVAGLVDAACSVGRGSVSRPASQRSSLARERFMAATGGGDHEPARRPRLTMG
mgnify:CR=1 FL=1